ncbi:hypothetical protein AcW1_008832 [Taiwanofungus camphoratus]|nr:hypothetical protein AcV7_003684 [Antrodia cinnamomea]KAI0949137.1 hypothetical protein AcW1_008832 [Antrodia cinnamomea]
MGNSGRAQSNAHRSVCATPRPVPYFQQRSADIQRHMCLRVNPPVVHLPPSIPVHFPKSPSVSRLAARGQLIFKIRAISYTFRSKYTVRSAFRDCLHRANNNGMWTRNAECEDNKYTIDEYRGSGRRSPSSTNTTHVEEFFCH